MNNSKDMDNALWQKIIDFDIDKPISEYGFSTRIAKDNYWTISFTEQAILEYKKFMCLAATSDLMVSPSPIVDTVWHEHLVFTQSYSDFCKLIGKEINHIPSTHNRQDFEKFKLAKERTKKLYETQFGKQPVDVWNSSTMFESLNLEKFAFKLRSLLLVSVFVFLILSIPSYYILKPLYITIDTSDFFLELLILIMIAFIGLEIYNRKKLTSFLNGLDKSSFLFKLKPSELVYLRDNKTEDVIHGHVSQLVEEQKISINKDTKISATDFHDYANSYEYCILETLRSMGPVKYPSLVVQLKHKFIFSNARNALDAFKKFFNKSKFFAKIFSINLGVLAFVLMLGFVRLLTGLMREKPVVIISYTLVFYLALIVFYLYRLTNEITSKTIPSYYESSIIPSLQNQERRPWNYFLLGNSALAVTFIPILEYYESSQSSSSDGSSSSSCSSGCGSSCSSCGGCGGD